MEVVVCIDMFKKTYPDGTFQVECQKRCPSRIYKVVPGFVGKRGVLKSIDYTPVVQSHDAEETLLFPYEPEEESELGVCVFFIRSFHPYTKRRVDEDGQALSRGIEEIGPLEPGQETHVEVYPGDLLFYTGCDIETEDPSHINLYIETVGQVVESKRKEVVEWPSALGLKVKPNIEPSPPQLVGLTLELARSTSAEFNLRVDNGGSPITKCTVTLTRMNEEDGDGDGGPKIVRSCMPPGGALADWSISPPRWTVGELEEDSVYIAQVAIQTALDDSLEYKSSKLRVVTTKPGCGIAKPEKKCCTGRVQGERRPDGSRRYISVYRCVEKNDNILTKVLTMDKHQTCTKVGRGWDTASTVDLCHHNTASRYSRAAEIGQMLEEEQGYQQPYSPTSSDLAK